MLLGENYRNDYVNFVNDVIVKGYSQKVPDDLLEAEPIKVSHISHQGIYHSKKPRKIRVVLECNVRYQGTLDGTMKFPKNTRVDGFNGSASFCCWYK